MRAAALDLDAVLGDTRPLWSAWLEDLARRARIELAVDDDRGRAAAELDAVLGNWRVMLARFAEDHAGVHLRPNADVNAALRHLGQRGVRLGAFTDAPAELASVALAHLGATRRLDAVEFGTGARRRLLERLGAGTRVIGSREELLRTELY